MASRNGILWSSIPLATAVSLRFPFNFTDPWSIQNSQNAQTPTEAEEEQPELGDSLDVADSWGSAAMMLKKKNSNITEALSFNKVRLVRTEQETQKSLPVPIMDFHMNSFQQRANEPPPNSIYESHLVHEQPIQRAAVRTVRNTPLKHVVTIQLPSSPPVDHSTSDGFAPEALPDPEDDGGEPMPVTQLRQKNSKGEFPPYKKKFSEEYGSVLKEQSGSKSAEQVDVAELKQKLKAELESSLRKELHDQVKKEVEREIRDEMLRSREDVDFE